MTRSATSFSPIPTLAWKGVAIGPGLTALTRTPRPISSLLAEAARESERIAVGQRIDARSRHADMRVDRGVDDDRGRIGEDRQERLDEKERPLEIDRERAVEAGLVPFLQRTEVADAGVEEGRVESAELLPDNGRDRLLRLDVAGVGRDRHDLAEVAGRRGQRLRIVPGDRHARPFLQEQPGCLEPDSRGAAGDEEPACSSSDPCFPSSMRPARSRGAKTRAREGGELPMRSTRT